MVDNSIIIKFEGGNEMTVGDITKVVGLVKARYFVPIIDSLNLDANPRASKTGAVTDSIQETITNSPSLLPFMTKGVLLASSNYDRLERGRIKISPENLDIEGILDGGHNTLAIGLYILKQSIEYFGEVMPKGSKTWDEFKALWETNRNLVEQYVNDTQKDDNDSSLDFLVPVELLVPRDMHDENCVFSFKNNLLEICEARNNNVELQLPAKANQKGYFDDLRKLLEAHNPNIANRIEWKTNDGGDVKVQDLIALSWIPLSLIDPVTDENHTDTERKIEPVSPVKLYSSKGSCMKQFEKLMSSPDVTIEGDDDYKRELANSQVLSAFKIATELPELYDYIYKMFPKYYNAGGGSFGGIKAVEKLNKTRKNKVAPFSGQKVDTVSPDGFIVPLVYGLQALMVKKEVNGETVIEWVQSPMPFLQYNLEKIVAFYQTIFSALNYDPQKVGKESISYNQSLSAFKMALAGML